VAYALGSALLGASAAAQTSAPRLFVSTTDDTTVGTAIFDDASLIAVGGNATLPSDHFAANHWLATIGFVPTDVDALARTPAAAPGSADSLVFSFLSSEGGVEDGDVLGLAVGGGLSVLVSEIDLVTALGDPAANVDVDALAYDDQARLLFSLQTDLTTASLGTLSDGDVLRYDAGVVTLVLSEAEVQARFTAATGSTSAIGDVLGLEWLQGEVVASVQSPSAWDGALFTCGTVPLVVADENQVGLGGTELDALSLVKPGEEISGFTIDRSQASPGETFLAEFHGRPASAQLVLMCGNAGYYPFTHKPGFGAFFFDLNDPWLNAVVTAPGLPVVFLDGNGYFATNYTLPSTTVYGLGFGGEEGWSFQMIDGSTLEVSAPGRIEKL
jgi:hypothetical protein